MKFKFAWAFVICMTLVFSLTGLLIAQSIPGHSETSATPMTYQEAPMLSARVTADELPPIEARLPDNAKVVPVVESMGRYGGTWRTVTWWSGAGNIKMKFYDPPIRWKADLTGYEPGLLAKMPVWSDDGRTITFTYRSGLKWSDGKLFTTDDLRFWWEDLAKNDNYSAVQVPWWARNTDGTAISMEFPDATTWVLHFDAAQYIMPYVLAQGFWEWEPLMKPAHYLKQWHPDYDGTSYDELAYKDNWFETPGYPCLMAWCLQSYQEGESWLFERNPYYWKVDPNGRQLPYIDYVEVELVEDYEVRKLKIASGDYDCTFRGVDDPADIPYLESNAAAGGYEVLSGWMNGAGAWPGFIVNQDYHSEIDYDPATEPAEDAEIRELLRNKSFRRGLSHVLDRQRVLDEVWGGEGEVKQFTISPQSPHFASTEGQAVFEAWATSYVTHATVTAENMWDSIGFVDGNGDGWRDLPSGEPFTLTIDLNDWGGEQINTQATNIFRQNLESAGVRVLVNNVIFDPEGSTRADHGLYMIRTTHASELDLWTYPEWVFPIRGGDTGRAFPMQGLWYETGGTEGWEPASNSPAEQLQSLYDQGLHEANEQARDELVWDAVDVHITDGPFVIGATGDQQQPVVCKTYFRNVPSQGVLGPWAPAMPGSAHPEQFWIGGEEVVIDPETGGAFTFTDSQGTETKITAPPGSVAKPTTLSYLPLENFPQPFPGWFSFADLAFSLDAYQSGTLMVDFTFAVPVTLTFNYSNDLVDGLDEANLKLTYWDENAETWYDVTETCSPSSTYIRDLAENRLSVPICHLSRFALFDIGIENKIFLPLVLRQP